MLDVAKNHYIDAPSVERWLIGHAPAGVDTTQDTLFFINWWGRDDFKHHVYTKTNEPDPDTGYNFGVQRESRKIIAWGGTPPTDEENGLAGRARVWFYDLSAGPRSWTDNWNVDDPDLDGNGVRPTTACPRSGSTSSRAATGRRGKLTADLTQIARYVGIDLLFTTSPLYPPALTPPRCLVRSTSTSTPTRGGRGSTHRARSSGRAGPHERAELLRIPTTLDQDLPLEVRAEYCFLR